MRTTREILAVGAIAFVLGIGYLAEWRNRKIVFRKVPSQAVASSVATSIDQFYVE